MTHQAHNIPWSLLAQNLAWRGRNPCEKDATNFHWRQKPAQGRELTHFVKAFARNIDEHATGERQKLPAEYAPPHLDEVVISDETCRKIAPTLRHRSLRDRDERDSGKQTGYVVCPHREDQPSPGACQCDLPWRFRKMRVFMQRKRYNLCYKFYEVNAAAFYALEIFKTLLMYGETDTILRIYSQPGHSLADWWEAKVCYDNDDYIGWDVVCKLAMKSYLVLNLILSAPETWEDGHEDALSYQNTKVYQDLVRHTTRPRHDSDLPAFPHRQFFGITDNHFQRHWVETDRRDPSKTTLVQNDYYPSGQLPYRDVLRLGRPGDRMATVREIAEIRDILRRKGLPFEIGDMILRRAGLNGLNMRRLEIEHDPLHPLNREELNKYLKFCWTLMVRCEVVARAIGLDIRWEQMLTEGVSELFDCPSHRSCRYDYDYDYDTGQHSFI